MDPRVPSELREPLARLTGWLRASLPVAGVYLHGSIAQGAFDPRTSDVDLVATLDLDAVGRREIAALRAAHRALAHESPWGRRLESSFVPARAARSAGSLAERYPRFDRARARGLQRLPAVARRLLARGGVTLSGEPAVRAFADVDDAAIRDEMHWNLASYWRGRLRRPHLFLSEEMARFAATTIPRILHTLETGDIPTKPEALAFLETRLPEFAALADDVRAHGRRLGRLARARLCLGLTRTGIARAREGA